MQIAMILRRGAKCAGALLAVLSLALPTAAQEAVRPANPPASAQDAPEAPDAGKPQESQESQESQDPQDPQDPLTKEMVWISKMLANAEMRLRTGVRGIERRTDTPTQPVTPGRQCCQSNLDHIEKSLQIMREELQATGTCFERRRDREGTRSVTEITQRMRVLDQALRQFAEAPTPARAADAMSGGVRRAYLSLLDGLEAFQGCTLPSPSD